MIPRAGPGWRGKTAQGPLGEPSGLGVGRDVGPGSAAILGWGVRGTPEPERFVSPVVVARNFSF